MAEFRAQGREVETAFDLIGDSENDITKSIAWAFVKSPVFLESVIEWLLHINVDAKDVIIRYQVFDRIKVLPILKLQIIRNFILLLRQSGDGYSRGRTT